MKSVKRSLLLVLLLCACAFGQGSVLLVGGGSEDYNDWSDEAYRWLVQRAANQRVLVLHYSDPSSFLPNYFESLGAVEATNLVIASRAAANDSAIYSTILKYDGLFLRGGDQWLYVDRWRGTLAERAIKEVFTRGGVVGGTSAGAMVLSEVVFDARLTSVDPRAALRNPLQAGITFTDDFLNVVPEILIDTHFYERGRIGRLLAMLAMYRAQKGRWISGVGIDDRTALGVSADGSAEVFGSGAVSVLRPTATTAYSVQTSQPLALSNMQMIQMTRGFVINLTGGEIVSTPPTAVGFHSTPTAFPSASVITDGSNNSIDWFSSSGSVARFLAPLSSAADTIGIFVSATSAGIGQTVGADLAQRGFHYRLFAMDATTKNDLAYARDIVSCNGFIFAANNLDSTASWFGPGSLVGSSFRSAAVATSAVLFLGDDCKLAGLAGIGLTEISTTAAYRGRLKNQPGMDVLAGVLIMPRVFENSDFHENRLSGVMWGIAKTRCAFAILLDAGTGLQFTGAEAQAFGRTPAIIVDARNTHWRDFSTYRASGSVGPRQSAALVDAVVHVVADSATYRFAEPTDVAGERRAGPQRFRLDQNFPNPFNPITTIPFHLPRSEYSTLKVFDVLGREVAKLMAQKLPAGEHKVVWNASDLPNGLYFCRIQIDDNAQTIKLLLLK